MPIYLLIKEIELISAALIYIFRNVDFLPKEKLELKTLMDKLTSILEEEFEKGEK